MLKITEVREFARRIEVKVPSLDGSNKYETQHFGCRFRILDQADSEAMIRNAQAVMKRAAEARRKLERGEPIDDDEEDMHTHSLEVFDRVVVGVDGIGGSDGNAYEPEEALALIRKFPDLVAACVEEYNLAMRESGNVRAKNLKK